jgi:DNA replication protein DnaC
MEINKEHLNILLKAMPPRFRDLKPETKLFIEAQGGKSFLITGTVGTGKTRLLLEILLADMLSNFEIIKTVNFDEVYFDKNPQSYIPKVNKKFLTVPDVLRKIKDEFDKPVHPSFIDNMMNTDILYLDDLGTEKASDWVKEQLYLVINHRYNYMKSTVITTNLSVSEIAESYGERFASRLVEMCEIIKLVGEDRRTQK